jgi:hypothetical protein
VDPGPRQRASQAGTTLLEVLAAIFVMGVGLLALLTLFPLGALEMAQAIKDDRTAAVANSATALAVEGEYLITRTATFVEASLAAGTADPKAAAGLREEYQEFALHSEDIESQLLELQVALEPNQIDRYVGPLLAQIRSIRRRVYPVVVILWLVERGEGDLFLATFRPR